MEYPKQLRRQDGWKKGASTLFVVVRVPLGLHYRLPKGIVRRLVRILPT